MIEDVFAFRCRVAVVLCLEGHGLLFAVFQRHFLDAASRQYKEIVAFGVILKAARYALGQQACLILAQVAHIKVAAALGGQSHVVQLVALVREVAVAHRR